MKSRILLIPFLLFLKNAGSVEFSKTEWANPGSPGSSIWLKNGKGRAIVIRAVYFRNDGIRTGDEIALSLGRERHVFAAQKEGPGRWIRLRSKGGRKIRVRSRDSLFVHGFEYRDRPAGKQGRAGLKEEYVLDLKLIDDTGDSCTLKISQAPPDYSIDAGLGAGIGDREPGP